MSPGFGTGVALLFVGGITFGFVAVGFAVFELIRWVF